MDCLSVIFIAGFEISFDDDIYAKTTQNIRDDINSVNMMIQNG